MWSNGAHGRQDHRAGGYVRERNLGVHAQGFPGSRQPQGRRSGAFAPRQGGPTTSGRVDGVEVPGDRDEADSLLVEPLVYLHEAQQRPRQAINFVHHNHIHLTRVHVGQQTLKSGARSQCCRRRICRSRSGPTVDEGHWNLNRHLHSATCCPRSIMFCVMRTSIGSRGSRVTQP